MISKINKAGKASLVRKYEHNYRTEYVPNVIPELSDQNEELVPLLNSKGDSCTYIEAWEERLAKLEHYTTHNIRKNGVIAYELVLTFSKEVDINIEEWKKDNVKWLTDTFDVCPEKYGSNVLSVMYHGDECGNVHCHALVTPIDERGRFCASRFTGNRTKMSELQTSYAKSMAHHGLERGLRGSSAKHQDIRKMYARLNQRMDIPKPMKNESAEQFRSRILELLQTERATDLKRTIDMETRLKRIYDKKMQEERHVITNAVYAEHITVIQQTRNLQEQLQLLEKSLQKTESEKEEYIVQIRQMQTEAQQLMLLLKNMERARKHAQEYEHLKELLTFAQKEYPEIASEIQNSFEYLETQFEKNRDDEIYLS